MPSLTSLVESDARHTCSTRKTASSAAWGGICTMGQSGPASSRLAEGLQICGPSFLHPLERAPSVQNLACARNVRRLRQDRLPALPSGSISVPIREPGIPCTSSNGKDRAAPNHAARSLLQAEGDALEYIPPLVRSLRPSRRCVECRAFTGCREASVQIRRRVGWRCRVRLLVLRQRTGLVAAPKMAPLCQFRP